MKFPTFALALALSTLTFASSASATTEKAHMELCSAIRPMLTSAHFGEEMRIFYENMYHLQNCARHFDSDGRLKSAGRTAKPEGGASAATGLSGAENERERTYIPAGLRGTWASGSCTGSESASLVVLGTMVLEIEDGVASIRQLSMEPEADEHGWIRARSKGRQQFFRRAAGESDVLEVVESVRRSGEERTTTGPGAVPDPAVWSMVRLGGCPGLPPVPQAIYGEMFSVLRALDAAVPICEAEPQRCAAALFETGDVNPDGRLNTAEISRLLRALVQFGAILNGRGTESRAKVIATGVSIAPIAAWWLISSFDYNGDDGLSLDEMTRDRVLQPSAEISDLLSGAESVVSDIKDGLGARASELDALLRLMR